MSQRARLTAADVTSSRQPASRACVHRDSLSTTPTENALVTLVCTNSRLSHIPMSPCFVTNVYIMKTTFVLYLTEFNWLRTSTCILFHLLA